jgi:putative ABC transport system permease protein
MMLFARALIAAIAAAASRLRLFSLRELAVHRRRTIASIAVMAVSAMYLVAIFGIFGSITGSVNRLADGVAGIAALEVSGITDAGFPDSIAADVAAVPGVAVAAPMIRMSAPTASRPVLLFGVDKSSAELGGTLTDTVSRPLEEVSQATDGVQVGPGVGHAKGEQFQLGSGTVTVTDVLQGEQQADLNGGQYVLAPLALAQNITGRQGRRRRRGLAAAESVLIAISTSARRRAVVEIGRRVPCSPQIYDDFGPAEQG